MPANSVCPCWRRWSNGPPDVPARAVTPANDLAVNAAMAPPITKVPKARWPASVIPTPRTLKMPPPIMPPTAMAVASRTRSLPSLPRRAAARGWYGPERTAPGSATVSGAVTPG